MTTLTAPHASSFGLVGRFKVMRARRRAYTQTYSELFSLGDLELHDIGIDRSDIRRLALEAADSV